MNIENQIIKVRINNFNIKHFKKLGYKVKMNQTISIKVKELPQGSGIKINVICKYCNKKFKKPYRRYLETKDDICCDECKTQKSKSNNIKKLDFEYPFKSVKILKKHSNPAKGRACPYSSQQKYLHNLYGGILNYSFYPFFLDVYFKKEKIDLEYDGSGHDLSVKLGTYSKKEFKQREIWRENFLLEHGIKQFRIVSLNDIIPPDDILIEIKNRAFDFLLNQGYNVYIYDVDSKTESLKA